MWQEALYSKKHFIVRLFDFVAEIAKPQILNLSNKLLNLADTTKLEYNNLSSGTHAMFTREYGCLLAAHFKTVNRLLVLGYPAPEHLTFRDVPGLPVNESHYFTQLAP